MLGIADDIRKKSSRKRRSVTFNDEEIIINPEDVDPNVGRFRNLVQTTVVPAKRARYDGSNIGISAPTTAASHNNVAHNSPHQFFQQNYQEHIKSFSNNPNSTTVTTPLSPTSLYQGLPAANAPDANITRSTEFDVSGPLGIGSKLGLLLPNPAPDVTPIAETMNLIPTNSAIAHKLALANAKARYDDHHRAADVSNNSGPQKKKYAKEAWPGRKPMLGSL